MSKQRDSSGNGFITCQLSADDFELYEGDLIEPGREIGIDVRTGSGICLDGWGRVATAYYNPMNDSYLVMINRLSEPRLFSGRPQSESLITA